MDSFPSDRTPESEDCRQRLPAAPFEVIPTRRTKGAMTTELRSVCSFEDVRSASAVGVTGASSDGHAPRFEADLTLSSVQSPQLEICSLVPIVNSGLVIERRTKLWVLGD
jgi:hypothetical protein